MPTFSIQIDASQLIYSQFQIPEEEPPAYHNCREIQTLSLRPGTYHFFFASGYYADFTFEVTPTGRIAYNTSFDGFLRGRGETRLTISGFQVTFDARYLPGPINLLTHGNPELSFTTCRLVPASYYSVLAGSGMVPDFKFALRTNGLFEYNSAYEYRGSIGFLRGLGTNNLEFLGYPVLVDARAAGGIGIQIVSVLGLPFDFRSVQFANLLPISNPYKLMVRPDLGVSEAGIILADDGTIRPYGDPSRLDVTRTFFGVPQVVVTRPIV